MAESSHPKTKAWEALLSFQIFWFLLIAGLWIGLIFSSPLDQNYTSGELLDHFLAWIQNGSLYSPLKNPPYRVLNYPPLFLMLTRGLSWMGIAPLTAGRWVNLAAALGACLVLYRWLKNEGCRTFTALGIVALLGTSFPVLYSLAQFQHQFLAIAFTLGGFYLISKPDRGMAVVLGGVLTGLACFVKQTQVIPALIALTWLTCYHRRHLLPYLFSLGLTGVLGALWLYSAFGMEVWRHLLVYTVGTFSFRNLGHELLPHFLPWSVFAFIALMVGLKKWETREDLRWWYFCGTSLWLLSSARIGSSSMYFIEWSFAVLLWIGPWLDHWMFQEGETKNRLLSLALIVQILGGDLGVAAVLFINAKQLKEKSSLLPKICEKLPFPPSSPLPFGDPGMARACGQIPALHPFIMASLAKQGLWDEGPFVEQLTRGTFPVIVLPFDPNHALSGVNLERWTPAMIRAIRKNYFIWDQEGEWRILKPKPR